MNRYQALSAALDANLGKPLRAERDRDHLALFVDPVNIASMITNSNQLIYGRRGAGKTITFRAIHELIGQEMSDSRVYSFYYSATDFRSSPDESGSQPVQVKTMAHRYFFAFIQRLVDDILILMDEIVAKPDGLSQLGRGSAARRARRMQIDNLGIHLLEASGYGTDAVDLASKRRRRSQTTVASRATELSGEIQASARSGVDIGLGAKRSRSKSATTSETIEYSPIRQFEPHRVRDSLHKMIELLDIDHIVILIDEWMSLAECQIHFAERLKQCLFGEPKIAVKIAADQYQGRLNNSETGNRFKGLELGADIFLAADLDGPFRNALKSRSLFTQVLYRRLLAHEPELARFFSPPDDVNEDYFRDTLFANIHAFDVLCYAAQGLCRDFFEIFEMATKEANLKVSAADKITPAMVEHSIVENSKTVYLQIEDRIDLNQLFQVITRLAESTGSRYFVVPASANSHDDLLRDLMQLRVIHGVERSLLDPSIRAQYRVFEIDYGVSIETARTREWATGKRPTIASLTDEVGLIDSDNVEKHILDLEGLKRDESVRCTNPECAAVFSATEPSYLAKRYCPQCFERVRGKSGSKKGRPS